MIRLCLGCTCSGVNSGSLQMIIIFIIISYTHQPQWSRRHGERSQHAYRYCSYLSVDVFHNTYKAESIHYIGTELEPLAPRASVTGWPVHRTANHGHRKPVTDAGSELGLEQIQRNTINDKKVPLLHGTHEPALYRYLKIISFWGLKYSTRFHLPSDPKYSTYLLIRPISQRGSVTYARAH